MECDDPPGDLLVRVEVEPVFDVVMIRELRFATRGNQFLTARAMRMVPLGALESQLAVGDVAKILARRMGEPVPDTSTEGLIAACGGRGSRPTRKQAEPPAVSKPSTRAGYDTTFYAAVAARYSWLVSHGEKAPAPAIAAEAGVPTTAVHRWVMTARDRTLLPNARRGRVG